MWNYILKIVWKRWEHKAEQVGREKKVCQECSSGGWRGKNSWKPHYKFLNQKCDKTNHSDNRMWKAAQQRETSDVNVYTLFNLCNNQRSVCLHTICTDEKLRIANSFHNYNCTHRHSSLSSLNLYVQIHTEILSVQCERVSQHHKQVSSES